MNNIIEKMRDAREVFFRCCKDNSEEILTQKDIDDEMWVNVLLVGAGLGVGTLVVSCFAVVIYNLIPDDMKKKKKA